MTRGLECECEHANTYSVYNYGSESRHELKHTCVCDVRVDTFLCTRDVFASFLRALLLGMIYSCSP